MKESTFILIVVFAPFIVGLLIGILRRNKKEGIIIQIIGWIFYMIIPSFAAGILFSELNPKKSTVKEYHYLYIKSLRNISSTEGEFFLGSGSIESVEYYYFFYQSTIGLKRSKIPVNNISIIETDERPPEIVKRKQCYSQDTFIKWRCREIDSRREDAYIMYVPKNTIIKEFKVY